MILISTYCYYVVYFKLKCSTPRKSCIVQYIYSIRKEKEQVRAAVLEVKTLKYIHSVQLLDGQSTGKLE